MSDPTKILVIFDLDFTLIDNSFTICKAFEYALIQFQITPPPKVEIIRKIGIPLEEMFLDYIDEAKAKKGVLLFREYYSTHFFEGVKIITGAITLLEELKEIGYRLALLTSKKTEYAIKLLKHINLEKYFEIIIGEQAEFKPKPDPASINLIVSKFPDVKKTFMIGDHVVDGLAAKNAGIFFIGVLTGNTTHGDLKASATPEAIILESVQEINPTQHLI